MKEGESEELVEQVVEIARQQVDPERLLDGEDESTVFPEDARHWVEVYTELVGFKQALIERLSDSSADLDTDHGQDEARGDRAILEMELARLQGRAGFWKKRLVELAGA